MSWKDRWYGLEDDVLEAGPITLHEFLNMAVKYYPELGEFLQTMEIPNAPESLVYKRFILHIGADLLLEANETDGDPAEPTIAEFAESVARAMRNILGVGANFVGYGAAAKGKIANVFCAASDFLYTYARYFGEGVGRAGEKRPMFDPNDFGSGNNPWSIPGH